MFKRKKKLEIMIKLNSLESLEEFLEKRIMPLRKKYPYADIRIEIL